ncbi:MAG TPA: phage tail sheath family protein [Methanotrichaceae archaeon]|nr:phage tail sheath family protein [Methanotrichaceae archaeon]
MPSTLTYPGVYIEEIPSGVRTITGVATSVTAFIGRARRGPVNEPVTINNFGDFERTFGGLWLKSTMSYALRDFYLNGGAQAVIVRLDKGGKAAELSLSTSKAEPPATEPLSLVAANVGVEGNDITAKVTYDKIDPKDADRFNLIVTKGKTTEKFPNISVKSDNEGYVLKRLEQESKLVKVASGSKMPGVRPLATANPVKATGGSGGGGVAASLGLPTSKEEPPATEPLSLVAANVGAWGNDITAEINYDTKNTDDKTLFNLIVSDGVTSEEFLNVSVNSDNARYVLRVLEQGSMLFRVEEDSEMPGVRPLATDHPVHATGGGDGDDLGSGEFLGSESAKTGIYALEKADIFNLLCIPPYKEDGNVDYDVIIDPAAAYCEKRRAMLVIDPPSEWTYKKKATDGIESVGTTSKNSALFFPRLRQPNPLRDNQTETFAPCGAVAGVFARTDTQRGVWKAPAGLDATLVGVPQLSVPLTDPENGELNPLGINCLRAMPAAGRVIWGSRTLQGNDRLASEWKYIPVRRVALYIEESLYRGTQWVVFEPNDEPLWAQIRLNIGAFMHNLFRQGAFQGTTPKDAYFVKCDKETTTQNDIDRGIVNILVGFAPLKPAEFVVIKIQQMAGQIQT